MIFETDYSAVLTHKPSQTKLFEIYNEKNPIKREGKKTEMKQETKVFQMEKNNSKPEFLIYLVVLQVLVFLVVVLDIQYVRQVLVSLYLFFVPGYALLKALGIERSNKTDTILFSVGLSIVFIMLIGLILNSLGFVEQPLSTMPLLIATSFCVPLIGVLTYIYRSEESTLSYPHDVKLSQIIPYVTVPLLSSIGMLLVRASENNILLILAIIIISVIFALATFSKIPVSHYPFVLISTAVALLLMTHLTSNYLNGWDVHYEYAVFSATKNASYWNPSLGLDVLAPNAWMYFYVSNSMLGSTVLPTVFSNMSNISGTLVFNILHTLVFSFVPPFLLIESI